MKLLTIALVAMGVLLCGCHASQKNENGAYVANKQGDEWHVKLYGGTGDEWSFKYAEVDGHEYLIMIGNHRSGLAHSPKCPCQRNKLILDIAPPDGIYPPPPAVELVNINTNNCIMPTNMVWGGGI